MTATSDPAGTITHEAFWRALDTLAAERGLSPSGLARAAGLDPTTFNRSKRLTPAGVARWPSTETLARVLAATRVDFGAFAVLLAGASALRSGGRRTADRVRSLPFSRLGEEDLFDIAGRPVASGWGDTLLPTPAEPGCYAVMVDTDALEPSWRRDAVLLLSSSPRVMPGDRVLRWHRDPSTGRVRLSAVILPPPGAAGTDATNAIRTHRILWASF